MPPNVDMNLIREALMRRMGGGQQGSPMPMAAQVSQPSAALPTGGPNVAAPQPPTQSPVNPSQVPMQNRQAPAGSASPIQKVAGAAQGAAGLPDPETRTIAKALLGKLVQFL